MDPDANLRQIRALVADVNQAVDADSDVNGADAVETLCSLVELVDALDCWLSRGGFLPERWAVMGRRA